jgi:hypothetical protein
MSLSIGTSLAAHAAALEHEAASLVLYNGHAGLGANAAGSLAGRSADDEVQVAFEHGQLQGPLVVAPLWNGTAGPPTHDAGAASKHPDLHAQLPSQERMHPASAAGKSDSLPQEFLEVIGGAAASVAFVVGAFSLGPTASTLLTAYFAGLGPRD